MRWLAVALLAACNSVFGLNDTRLPPPDAPPECPATGVPRFSRNVHQVYLQSCSDYTASDDRLLAVAVCDVGGNSFVSESVGGAPFANAVLPGGNTMYEFPRLTADGKQLYVRAVDPNGDRYVWFGRTGSAWTAGAILTLPSAINFAAGWITAPTMTSPRHLIAVGTPAGSPALYELVEGPTDTWTVQQTYDPTQLGFAVTFTPGDLSSDGLRLVLPAFTNAANRPLYFVRESIDTPWASGTPLDDVPPINDPFLSNDCGRLYFSAIDSVFYVEQQ